MPPVRSTRSSISLELTGAVVPEGEVGGWAVARLLTTVARGLDCFDASGNLTSSKRPM